jgi:hypothetical protein
MASKPIPKSHLNRKGQQTLLLDLDRKRAVSLGHYLTDNNAPLVPTRFTESHNVVAWYAGPNAVPVGTPIVRHYPQPLTRAQRERIKELEDASKVWLQMQPEPDVLARHQRRTNTPTLKVIEFADVSFAALTSEHRTSIAVHGFDMIVKEEHPYLVFNVEGTTD